MQLPYQQYVRLKVSSQGWRSALLGIGLFLIILFALEGFARSPFVQDRLPFQAYGSNHVQFEMQVQNLEIFSTKHGPPNCFILGNSQSLRAIDPETLNPAFEQISGESISCYNFSVVGANISSILLFSNILIDRYQPDLLILGINYLDFRQTGEDALDPRFEENAWIDWQIGRPSFKGWLFDNSSAYRAFTLFSYGAPSGFDFDQIEQEVEKWRSQLDEYGHGVSQRVENLAEAPKPGFANNFIARFGDFTLSSRSLDSLEALLVYSNDQDVSAIIVEMPYHSSLLELRDQDGVLYNQAEKVPPFIEHTNAAIAAIAERQGVLFLTSGTMGDLIPDESWHDRYHLNQEGSPLFSYWLAEMLWQAVQDGRLEGE